MKKVLILGSGMVAGPIIDYLLTNNYLVTIATPLVERALELVDNHPNAKVINWNIEEDRLLSNLIADNDITVSLIPYTYHTIVARHCITHRKNMLTTSYVSNEMKSMYEDAKKAGILILNEIGLDPGIDHMSAKKIIDEVHKKGGVVKTFYSFCGALPAPEAADNPFKYKFSWSPRGVLLAGKNNAQYKYDSKLINVDTESLFKDVRNITFPDFGAMEVYPNRDSLSYIELYNIPEVETIMRGTIRYKGWCKILDALKKMNLLSDEDIDCKGFNIKEFVKELCNKNGYNFDEILLDEHINYALKWAGFLSQDTFTQAKIKPFDLTADLMIPKMMITENERDMVQMLHWFVVKYPDGKTENIRSSMLVYGTVGGNTAVAKTVALPAAMGVRMILEGKIDLKGVHIPTSPEIYLPILSELEKLGICLNEEYNMPSGMLVDE